MRVQNILLKNYSVFFIAMILFSFNVKAFGEGSGAGGIIRFINNSDIPVDVTWSGVGCIGMHAGMGLVCYNNYVYPQQHITYAYSWGISGTWLNVANLDAKLGIAYPCGLYGPKADCYFDHYTVGTEAYKVNICTMTNIGKKLHLTCTLPQTATNKISINKILDVENNDLDLENNNTEYKAIN